MAAALRWCYTLNNYTPEEGVALTEIPCRYQICGREVGESGTPHLQGYVVFEKQKRLAAVRKLNARCHWEVAKGSTEQNVIYCSKDGDFCEVGAKPKTAKEVGQDNHIRWLDVVRSAKEGMLLLNYRNV